MLNKLLTAISVALLVVIVGEVIYFVATNNLSQKGSQTNKNSLPLHPSTNISSEAYKKLKFEPAIHPTVLKQLAKFMKSAGGSLYILQEQTSEVRVLAIEPKGACVEDRRNGIHFEGTICFPFAMKLEDKTIPEGYTWRYFTETNIKKTIVYSKNTNGEKMVSIRDIRPGDKITTVEKWDPSVPFDINTLIEYLDRQMVELTIYISRNT